MTIIQERKRDPLEDLSSMIGDLRNFAQSAKRVRIKQEVPLLDVIANEICETAGIIITIIITIGGIDDYLLKLVKIVMNAHEPRNRPKIYDDDALYDLCYAIKDVSIGKVRSIDVFILISELAKREVKAHYSGCECPLYLLEIC